MPYLHLQPPGKHRSSYTDVPTQKVHGSGAGKDGGKNGGKNGGKKGGKNGGKYGGKNGASLS